MKYIKKKNNWKKTKFLCRIKIKDKKIEMIKNGKNIKKIEERKERLREKKEKENRLISR